MMRQYTMTWNETFRAIRDGDVGVTVAFLIEIAIMASPFAILAGAYFWSA